MKILDEDIAVGRLAVVDFALLFQSSRKPGKRSTSGSKVFVNEDLVFRVTCVMVFELKPGFVYCIAQLLTAETHDYHTIPLLAVSSQFRAQATCALCDLAPSAAAAALIR